MSSLGNERRERVAKGSGDELPPRRHGNSLSRERRLAVLVLLAAVGIVAVVGALARSSPSSGEASWTFASDLGRSYSTQPTEQGDQNWSTSTSESAPSSETTQSTLKPSPQPYSPEQLALLSAPLPAGAVAVNVPVLMYHYVDETPPPAGPYADALTVRTPDFVDQLEYLRAKGFSTVSLADVYLAMAGALTLPSKAVVLTFDDGGLDNYEVAFRLLRTYGFTATFFVITSRVGKEGQMTWDQLREMNEAGMAVQSHTVSHPDLTQISSSKLAQELGDSRAKIEEEIGAPVYALAYPAGAYNSRVIQAAKEAGYSLAVSTDKGGGPAPQTVFEIKRARIQAGLSLATFARIVGGQ